MNLSRFLRPILTGQQLPSSQNEILTPSLYVIVFHSFYLSMHYIYMYCLWFSAFSSSFHLFLIRTHLIRSFHKSFSTSSKFRPLPSFPCQHPRSARTSTCKFSIDTCTCTLYMYSTLYNKLMPIPSLQHYMWITCRGQNA